MSALSDFRGRHVLVYALLVGGIVGGTIASRTDPVSTVDVHLVQEDETGSALVKAADARITDQFDDIRRLVILIDGLADQPIAGVEKMRAVSTAFNRLAAMTPDGGAAAHDAELLEVAGVTAGVDFRSAVDRLNDDKKDLSRAVRSLRKIQDAFFEGNEDELADNLAELESAVGRFDNRHAVAAHSTADAAVQDTPIAVSLERVKTFVSLERNEIGVHIERPRVSVAP